MLMKVRINEAKEAAKKHALDVQKKKMDSASGTGSSSQHFSSDNYNTNNTSSTK